MSGSLAYRNNEAAIKRGDVPEKYTRLLPFITGKRVLELGSAEGVLALLLAKQGRIVTALEKNAERHQAAQNLYAEWLARQNGFTAPRFVNGDILNNLDLLENQDTFVGIRSIYYLRDNIDCVFGAVAEAKVPTVVLCGNKNRAARWRSGIPDDEGGPFNFYASHEGMSDLLKRHGYRISAEVIEGDEIVVGQMA